MFWLFLVWSYYNQCCNEIFIGLLIHEGRHSELIYLGVELLNTSFIRRKKETKLQFWWTQRIVKSWYLEPVQNSALGWDPRGLHTNPCCMQHFLQCLFSVRPSPFTLLQLRSSHISYSPLFSNSLTPHIHFLPSLECKFYEEFLSEWSCWITIA